MIPMKHQTTGRTTMLPLAQWFLFSVTTPRAILRRIRRVDQDDGSTSFCRFVDREGPDRRPGCVLYALGQTVVLDHIEDIEVLEHDNAIMVDEISTDSVGKVGPVVPDPLVDQGHDFPFLGQVDRPLGRGRKLSLSPLEIVFAAPKEPGVVDHAAPVGRQEIFQPGVQPDGPLRCGQPDRVYFNGEAHEPLSRRSSGNRRGLDFAVNRSMQVDPDVPDAPDPQDITVQDSTPGILGPAERIVAETISEPRVPGGFVLADPTEKSLKSQVNSFLGILQNLTVDFPKFWLFLLPLGQDFIGREQADPDLVAFPRGFPDLQSLVVDPTGQVEPAVQDRDLSLGTVQTVSVRFNYHALKVNVVKKKCL
jgi:hypothetical protein